MASVIQPSTPATLHPPIIRLTRHLFPCPSGALSEIHRGTRPCGKSDKTSAELHRLGGIYVGNDFQRLMSRAEVGNFFLDGGGERRGKRECMAAGAAAEEGEEGGEGADKKEP